MFLLIPFRLSSRRLWLFLLALTIPRLVTGQSGTLPVNTSEPRTVLYMAGKTIIEKTNEHLIYAEIIGPQIKFTIEDLKFEPKHWPERYGALWQCGKFRDTESNTAAVEIDVNQNGSLDEKLDLCLFQASNQRGTFYFPGVWPDRYDYFHPGESGLVKGIKVPVFSRWGTTDLQPQKHLIYEFEFPVERINPKNLQLSLRFVIHRAGEKLIAENHSGMLYGLFYYPSADCRPEDAKFYTIDFSKSHHPSIETAQQMAQIVVHRAAVAQPAPTGTTSIGFSPTPVSFKATVDYDGVYFEVKPRQLTEAVASPLRWGQRLIRVLMNDHYDRLRPYSFNHQTLNLSSLSKIILTGAEFSPTAIASVGVYELELVDRAALEGSQPILKDRDTRQLYLDLTHYYTTGPQVLTQRRQAGENRYELTFTEPLRAGKEYVIYTGKMLHYFRVLNTAPAPTVGSVASTSKPLATLPTADGLYLKTSAGQVYSLPVSKGILGYLIEGVHEHDDYYTFYKADLSKQLVALRDIDFTTANVLEVSRNKADELIVKGSYDLQNLNLHALRKLALNEYRVFTASPNTYDQTFKKAGYTGPILVIDTATARSLTKRKTVSTSETHIQLPYLVPGAYALNLGQSLWLINIKVN